MAQLFAILLKCWFSRKYHYVYTCLDIILPLLLAYLLVIFKGQNSRDEIEPEKIFLPQKKSFLMKHSYESKLDILYTPNSTDTNRIMSRVKDKLDPQKLGYFQAMQNDDDMEKWLFSRSVSNGTTYWDQGYGIVFHNVSENTLVYSIKNTKFNMWHTEQLFPEFPMPGPMESGAEYISHGFLAIQIAIDEAYMEYKDVELIDWSLQEFPYPQYRRVDMFTTIYKDVLSYCLCYGYLFTVITLIIKIGEEKRSGISERLKMIGVRSLITYLGWIIEYTILSLITSLVVAWLLTTSSLSKYGAVLEKSNLFVIWITIFIFYLSGTSLALTIANFFPRPKYSAFIGILVWLSSLGFFSYVMNKSPTMVTLFFMNMTPNGYLLSSMNAVIRLELFGAGVTFSNLFHYAERDGITMSLGVSWIAASFGCLVFTALVLYLDLVMPGPYGIPKPWYFVLPKRFLRSICKIGPAVTTSNPEDGSDCLVKNKENCSKIVCEPCNLPVGIKIINLSKTYGTIVALKDFSIDIHKNEITALLGHNGAGKTTLLSVITGMLAPSNGVVRTDGYNVFENLDEFRSDLGYCPQDDLLLPDLTVLEHLIFFGLVKGLSRSNAYTQAESILTKCMLKEKRNTRVAKLSGGMKRKLCLALSLVKYPKILILDEPTSGLDPESRRAIWDILMDLRQNHTIVFTTHFMEEADVLGNRIAIMSHGELKCYGSPLFLKKHYGSGYQVTILLDPDSPVDKIKEIVNSKINESSVYNESKDSITFQLPLHSVDKFPTLFEQLEMFKNVKSLAVSCTTIDDVFQKVNEEEGVKFSVDEVDMPLRLFQLDGSRQLDKGIKLLWLRLIAIGVKILTWIRRNWILTLLYLALPLVLVVIATYKLSTSGTTENFKPLGLDLNIYGPTYVVLGENQTDLGESFLHQINITQSRIINVESSSVVDVLLDYGRKDEGKYRTAMLVAGNMSDEWPTVLYSSIAYHSIPIAANLISNTIINKASPNSPKYSIKTYNDPYLFSSDSCSSGASDVAYSMAFTVMLVMEMTFIGSYFIILVHTERITLFKDLQLYTGLRYYFYWLFNFIVDIVIYILIILLLLVIILIFDPSAMIGNSYVFGRFLLVFLLFGVSTLWCGYFCSFFFKTYNSSTLFYTVISLALCMAGVIIYSFDAYKDWKYVFFLNPLNPLAAAVFKILSESKFDRMCKICTGPSIALMCKAKREMETLEDFDISLELIYLSLDWIPYFGLVCLIEAGVFSWIWHYIKSIYIGSILPEEPLDKDVQDEKKKIQRQQNERGQEHHLSIVNGLAKKYTRNMTAVKDVSFGVSPGECFGLLGTNGAGKSTTFQMLTTSLRPTQGDAAVKIKQPIQENTTENINGRLRQCGDDAVVYTDGGLEEDDNTTVNTYSIKRNKNQYKDHIGYCPQSGGLMGDLTGRETLRLFAALYGETPSEVNDTLEKWINLLELNQFADRPTSTYSGGNLRKLSTAIALIGNSSIVFLDEPTTGVDPVARRRIWQVLRMSLKNKQTIILASHSMDECEALCDRLTIMVRGSMQCIGNIQYLKKTHSKGFIILIKLGVINTETLTKLKEKMELLFSHLCTLRDEQKGLLHYHLEDPNCRWSMLFRNMAELKEEFSVGVEDYVLTDSSLEQIFLAFAKTSENNSEKKINI